ncbi:MAG: HDOD domain-containing protein [Desulfovibrionales bacterium]|nr:HDOD domain-containing protein [Desulfovibrionales bacterium]
MSDSPTENVYENIFVARQPIFTRDMQLWGHELLFRHGENVQVAVITDGDMATTQVIADGYALASQGVRPTTKALINFPRNMILSGAPFILPPQRCVVEILETVEPEPEVLKACHKLKAGGYMLALDDFVGQTGYEPLCELADLIKVDILHKTPADVLSIVEGLRPYNAILLAEKVENLEMFMACKKMGFTYFQGYFFSKPEVIPGRKLSANQTTKIKILKELNGSDTDMQRLVEIIQADLSLSYRLLRYINSARFGLQGKIESISRAATMLGYQNLKQWLRIIVLSDINTTDKAQELVRISIQRGRLLQLLAQQHDTPFDPDSMFLLGLFSMLDAILDQFMEHVLEDIPLQDALKDALANARNPNTDWIALLDEMDRCNWERSAQRASRLGIPMHSLSTASIQAQHWTAEVLGHAE